MAVSVALNLMIESDLRGLALLQIQARNGRRPLHDVTQDARVSPDYLSQHHVCVRRKVTSAQCCQGWLQ